MQILKLTETEAAAFEALPNRAGEAFKFWSLVLPIGAFQHCATVIEIERISRDTFRMSVHPRKLTKKQIREGNKIAKQFRGKQ